MLLDAVPEPVSMSRLDGYEGELRYVTQHFHDLQGVALAPYLAGTLILFQALPHSRPPVWVKLAVYGGLCVLTVVWARFISRWYRERYGFVTTKREKPERLPGSNEVTWLCFGLLIGLSVIPRFPPVYITMANSSLLFLLPKCLSVVPRSRPVRFRRLLYVAMTLFIISSSVGAIFSPIAHPFLIQLWLVSGLLMVFYDHWLLSYLLRPRRSQNPEALHD